MRRGASTLALLVGLAFGRPAAAHPMPFSSLDVRLDGPSLEVAITAHLFDLAHDLGVQPPERLLELHGGRAAELMAPRVRVLADGHPLPVAWHAPESVPDREGMRLRQRWTLPAPPGRLQIEALLFPYDR